MEDRDADQVERFGNERLKVVSKMNYLGVYLRMPFVGMRTWLRGSRRRIRLCE
jgi:hypothetical protein